MSVIVKTINNVSSLGRKEIVTDRLTCDVIGVISIVLCTALSAQVYIPLPFTPVPITLQTFFVFIAGIMLGTKLGTISQIIYYTLGMSNLPIFARGLKGLPVIFGPTGGYLLGFIIATLVIGNLIRARKETNFIWTSFALFIGMIIIYLFGAIQLSLVLRINMVQSITNGVLPFILGDILKILVAATICQRWEKRFRTVFE